MLFIAVIFFTSCEDEEGGTSKQINKTYTYSEDIRGSEGVKGELTLPELELDDMIGIEPANNLENAKMQWGDSYIEISGLSQIESSDTVAVVLEDFTIKVGTRQSVNLGDCSTDAQGGLNEFAADVEQSTNEILSVIQNIFTDVTSGNKSATIVVSFTPNVNITPSDNVRLNIAIGGTYSYVVFE